MLTDESVGIDRHVNADLGDSSPFRHFVARKRSLFGRGTCISIKVLWLQGVVHMSPAVTGSTRGGVEVGNFQKSYILTVSSQRSDRWRGVSGGYQDRRPVDRGWERSSTTGRSEMDKGSRSPANGFSMLFKRHVWSTGTSL